MNQLLQHNLKESLTKQFQYYQLLVQKTLAQIPPEKIFWTVAEEQNSIAIIMKHLAGNMLSRWTDFLTTDGEKPWRNRDEEFELKDTQMDSLMAYWERGWTCLYEALNSVQDDQWMQTIYIRNEGHTVLEAFLRQLAHYPYHVGQIVLLGKLIQGNQWQSLSIPKASSASYNKTMFNQEKGVRHFTDAIIKSKK